MACTFAKITMLPLYTHGAQIAQFGWNNESLLDPPTPRIGSYTSLSTSDNDVILEDQNHSSGGEDSQHCQLSSNSNDISSIDDDIKLLTEELVNRVVEDAETFSSHHDNTNYHHHHHASSSSEEIEEIWKDVQIDPDGETLLPNGLRVVNGIAEMTFFRSEEDDQPARFTNQLNFLKNVLTKYIIRYKTALPFMNPVDSILLKIPHYYLVIREPMDLNTVKNRINFLWYRSAAECVSDIRLIFSNCFRFNSPTDYVYKAGKKLEEYFEDKLKDMPIQEVEVPCPPRPSLEEYQKTVAKRIGKQQRTASMGSEISENGENSNLSSAGSFCGGNGGFLPYGPVKMTTRSERGVMVRKPSKDLPAPISTPQPKTPTVKKVPLNEGLRACYEFVKELFTKKHAEYAWPFWEPVNLSQYPDYLEKIKKPIDLSIIKTNLETGKYLTIGEFASDMRVMFSNCLRYNKAESPVIEQARSLRNLFEYKYATFPEEWLTQKLKIHHTSSNNRGGSSTPVRTPPATVVSPTMAFAMSELSSSSSSSVSKQQTVNSIKIKKNSISKLNDSGIVLSGSSGGGSSGRKRGRPSNQEKQLQQQQHHHSGQVMNNYSLFNNLSPGATGSSGSGESRMDFLEKQVATLTSALQCVVGSYAGDPRLLQNVLPVMSPAAMAHNANGKNPKGRPRKNGSTSSSAAVYQQQNNIQQKAKAPVGRPKASPGRKRKRHLSDSDSDDESSQSEPLSEPFDPLSINDLKKLKSDLENLPVTDLENVLRIMKNTEPSLRCDNEEHVEIDFEVLSARTLIALRKYVNSCIRTMETMKN